MQFRAAVASMPKLRIFSTERMPPHRIVSTHPGGFPFEVGLFMKANLDERTESCSDFLHILLETIAEEQGRITTLRRGNEMSASLCRINPSHHAALQHLTSLDLCISDIFPIISHESIFILQDALFQATELRELGFSVDCTPEALRFIKPLFVLALFFFEEYPDKVYRWEHLRSLKLGAVGVAPPSMLPVIQAHVSTLRHLHLDQCRPPKSFARDLSQLQGLQLDSITISDSEIPKSGLISEKELLRFIRQGDTHDPRQAKKIAKGKFVTHNRRADNSADDEPFEDPDSGHASDHSSEWWSDTDMESELDIGTAS